MRQQEDNLHLRPHPNQQHMQPPEPNRSIPNPNLTPTPPRSQLPPAAALALMPSLINLLRAEAYVVHSYAATAIERFLALKEAGGRARLSAGDVAPFAQPLLEALFAAFKHPERCVVGRAWLGWCWSVLGLGLGLGLGGACVWEAEGGGAIYLGGGVGCRGWG